MTVHGLALKMRLDLARLARDRGVKNVPSVEHSFPLLPPSSGPVIVEGVAAATSIDRQRMRLAPFAFGLLIRHPPLLWRHNPDIRAGRILDLRYDEDGALLIRAEVSHPLAVRCGAFSIAGRILAYELKDTGTDSFHALVSSCELTEISCTGTPANTDCVVLRRWPASAGALLLDDAGRRIEALRDRIREAA
jgi:hypothetical protein